MTTETKMSLVRTTCGVGLVAVFPSRFWGYPLPLWRLLLFIVAFLGWTWVADADARREMMERYEQTRAYLLREGWIDK